MKRKEVLLMAAMICILSVTACSSKKEAIVEDEVVQVEDEADEEEEEELDYEWEWIIDPRESDYRVITMIDKDRFIVSQANEQGSFSEGIINGQGEIVEPIGIKDYNKVDEMAGREDVSDYSAENGGRIDTMTENGWYYYWTKSNGTFNTCQDYPDSLRNKVDDGYVFLSGNDIDARTSDHLNYMDAFNLEIGVMATYEDYTIALCDKDGKTYMKPGKYCINPEKAYSYQCIFSDGRLPVKDCELGNWGYIDYTGDEVISTIYDFAGPFQEGLAFVDRMMHEPDMPVEYIDVNGNTVISIDGLKSEISRCIGGPFRDGYAVVRCELEDEDGVLTERCGLIKCNTEIFDERAYLKDEYKKYQDNNQ